MSVYHLMRKLIYVDIFEVCHTESFGWMTMVTSTDNTQSCTSYWHSQRHSHSNSSRHIHNHIAWETTKYSRDVDIFHICYWGYCECITPLNRRYKPNILLRLLFLRISKYRQTDIVAKYDSDWRTRAHLTPWSISKSDLIHLHAIQTKYTVHFCDFITTSALRSNLISSSTECSDFHVLFSRYCFIFNSTVAFQYIHRCFFLTSNSNLCIKRCKQLQLITVKLKCSSWDGYM